ncbi:MAG: hypothetical protein ACYSUQ_06560 [Planctomycetota bacterium]|jgi:hypothetical protein
MSDRQTIQSGSSQRQEPDSRAPAGAAPPSVRGELTTDQFERWVRLLAKGDAAFPNDLSAKQAERMLAEVRCQRRIRLIRLIARSIALDMIHSTDLPNPEDREDDCR